PQRLKRVRQKERRIYRGGSDRQLASIETIHVEQVANECIHLFGRLRNQLDVVSFLGFAIFRVAEQCATQHLHRRNRVSQIMRHDSYHFVACAQTCADGVVQTGVIQSKRSKPSEILRKSKVITIEGTPRPEEA